MCVHNRCAFSQCCVSWTDSISALWTFLAHERNTSHMVETPMSGQILTLHIFANVFLHFLTGSCLENLLIFRIIIIRLIYRWSHVLDKFLFQDSFRWCKKRKRSLANAEIHTFQDDSAQCFCSQNSESNFFKWFTVLMRRCQIKNLHGEYPGLNTKIASTEGEGRFYY